MTNRFLNEVSQTFLSCKKIYDIASQNGNDPPCAGSAVDLMQRLSEIESPENHTRVYTRGRQHDKLTFLKDDATGFRFQSIDCVMTFSHQTNKMFAQKFFQQHEHHTVIPGFVIKTGMAFDRNFNRFLGHWKHSNDIEHYVFGYKHTVVMMITPTGDKHLFDPSVAQFHGNHPEKLFICEDCY